MGKLKLMEWISTQRLTKKKQRSYHHELQEDKTKQTSIKKKSGHYAGGF